MDPRKINSDLDGEFWKPANESYNIPGRRLRNRTIPTINNCMRTNSCSSQEWTPCINGENIENVVSFDLEDTNIVYSEIAIELDL